MGAAEALGGGQGSPGCKVSSRLNMVGQEPEAVFPDWPGECPGGTYYKQPEAPPGCPSASWNLHFWPAPQVIPELVIWQLWFPQPLVLTSGSKGGLLPAPFLFVYNSPG